MAVFRSMSSITMSFCTFCNGHQQTLSSHVLILFMLCDFLSIFVLYLTWQLAISNFLNLISFSILIQLKRERKYHWRKWNHSFILVGIDRYSYSNCYLIILILIFTFVTHFFRVECFFYCWIKLLFKSNGLAMIESNRPVTF